MKNNRDYIFVNDFPKDSGGGWYAHYEHISSDQPQWKECPIRDIIAKNEEKWINDFDSWHSLLSKKALKLTRWWWFTQASRPNILSQQNTLKSFFFSLALREWLSQQLHHPPVFIIKSPPEVRYYLEESQGNMFQHHWIQWRSVAILLLKNILTFFRYVPLIFRKTSVKSAGLVVFSQVPQIDCLKDGKDHFFGCIKEILNQEFQDNILESYMLLKWSEQKKIRKVLSNFSPISRIFVMDYITCKDLIWVFFNFFRIYFSLIRLRGLLPVISIAGCKNALFSHFYFRQQIIASIPLIEFIIYRGMIRLLRETEAKILLYPYEEKGVERALLMASMESPNSVQCIAFAHAMNWNYNIAFRSRVSDSICPPAPHLIVVTGPHAKKYFIEWGNKPENQLAIIGSPKYKKKIISHRVLQDLGKCLRITIVVTLPYEIDALANVLQKKPNLFEGYEVLVRLRSSDFDKEQKVAMERLLSISPVFRVSKESLLNQIEWADVVIFGLSTVGIEAMLLGRLVIHMDLHDIFPVDPFLGKDAYFARANDHNELATALMRAQNISDEEYSAIIDRQCQFAESILSPLNEDALLNALSYKGSSNKERDLAGNL